MAPIYRVKTKWSGFNGGPGYSVMHFGTSVAAGGGGSFPTAEGAKIAVDKVQAFYQAIRINIPTAVLFDVEPDVDIIEDSTGELVNAFAVVAPAQVNGSGSGAYSAASGAVVNWRTAGIRNGRKIRGRTFIVPVGATALGPNGALAASARPAIASAAETMRAASGGVVMGVYARPTATGASDGVWHPATASSVPSMLAVLRSRRD